LQKGVRKFEIVDPREKPSGGQTDVLRSFQKVMGKRGCYRNQWEWGEYIPKRVQGNTGFRIEGRGHITLGRLDSKGGVPTGDKTRSIA